MSHIASVLIRGLPRFEWNFFFLVLLAALPGCATSGMLSNFSGREQVTRATAADPAVRCLCVWQSAEGSDPNGRPCRGMAGQVFFFSRSNPVPIAVDGDIKVYVFDDQGSEAEQGRPITEFDVDSATWNMRLMKTQFGPAYQLFVPHTRPGRLETHMAVRLRMTPKVGPPVFSDLSTIELSGPKASQPKLSPQAETAAKVDQALRTQLAGREQLDSGTNRSRADARSVVTEVLALNPQSNETVARIRSTHDFDRSAGAQFQVTNQAQDSDDEPSLAPRRIKLRKSSSTVNNEIHGDNKATNF